MMEFCLLFSEIIQITPQPFVSYCSIIYLEYTNELKILPCLDAKPQLTEYTRSVFTNETFSRFALFSKSCCGVKAMKPVLTFYEFFVI